FIFSAGAFATLRLDRQIRLDLNTYNTYFSALCIIPSISYTCFATSTHLFRLRLSFPTTRVLPPSQNQASFPRTPAALCFGHVSFLHRIRRHPSSIRSFSFLHGQVVTGHISSALPLPLRHP